MAALRLLHAWAGAILSLLLLVLGVTGSLLVFKDDWIRLTVPAAREALEPTPAALGAAAETLEAARPGEVATLVFGGAHLGVHRAYLPDGAQAYADASGRIVAEWERNGRPEAWLFDLHHHLLAGEAGANIAGVAGLAGVVLTITGVIVWAPAWRSFQGRLWPPTGRRRDLLAAHRDTGLIFALPLALLCLTGGAIIFHEASHAVAEAIAPGDAPAPGPPPPAGEGDVDWPRALAAAQARFPDGALRMASWPKAPGAPATIRVRQAGEWHPNGRTMVFIDPADSTVAGVLDAQALGAGMRAYNAFYPLHAAAVGGRAYDLASFASGLALASLGAFGLWSFLIKPRHARARRTLPAE